MTNLTDVLSEYRATGRLAFHYPRKNTVSLNGGKAVPVKDAIKIMRDCVKNHRPVCGSCGGPMNNHVSGCDNDGPEVV